MPLNVITDNVVSPKILSLLDCFSKSQKESSDNVIIWLLWSGLVWPKSNQAASVEIRNLIYLTSAANWVFFYLGIFAFVFTSKKAVETQMFLSKQKIIYNVLISYFVSLSVKHLLLLKRGKWQWNMNATKLLHYLTNENYFVTH